MTSYQHIQPCQENRVGNGGGARWEVPAPVGGIYPHPRWRNESLRVPIPRDRARALRESEIASSNAGPNYYQ